MATKAESDGVKRLKAAYTGSTAEWNAAIDALIARLTADKAADEALAALDLQAKTLVAGKKAEATAAVTAQAQVCMSAQARLGAGTTDPSITGVIASVAGQYADAYSRHVIYTNYLSKASFSYKRLQEKIEAYQASIDTLNSLKFNA